MAAVAARAMPAVSVAIRRMCLIGSVPLPARCVLFVCATESDGRTAGVTRSRWHTWDMSQGRQTTCEPTRTAVTTLTGDAHGCHDYVTASTGDRVKVLVGGYAQTFRP